MKINLVSYVHTTVVINGKSSLGLISPTDIINNALSTHTPNQVKIRRIAIGGNNNTYGVPAKNYVVHFIIATPIRILVILQQIQISRAKASIQTP